MADTNIEWATKSWNPARGCSRVSEGCRNCYAERQAIRHSGPGGHYEGLVRAHTKPDGRREPRWTGDVRFVPEKLGEPLAWRNRERVFVNSMSDLFHERIDFEDVAAVFGVMAACARHDFLVLTKRPERAREFFRWVEAQDSSRVGCTPGLLHCIAAALGAEVECHPNSDSGPLHTKHCADPKGPWPLPNVWLGVSVEDQATADERIPVLLDTPAAIRWVSYEPALGAVDFRPFMWPVHASWPARFASPEEARAAGAAVTMRRQALVHADSRFLDWVVVGGEGGPGARPFDLAWAESTIEACRAASVPCFVKQIGARAFTRGRLPPGLGDCEVTTTRGYADRKGGDMNEWPEDLRVREFPEVRRG